MIQRGLEAYNRRDLDGLMAVFDPQVRSPDFPDGTTRGETYAQPRADYAEGYRDAAWRPLALVGRMIHGAIVVDRYERAMGSGRVQTIMTIFEVRGGRIQRRSHVNR